MNETAHQVNLDDGFESIWAQLIDRTEEVSSSPGDDEVDPPVFGDAFRDGIFERSDRTNVAGGVRASLLGVPRKLCCSCMQDVFSTTENETRCSICCAF